jgi:HEXXH motif-containing protein
MEPSATKGPEAADPARIAALFAYPSDTDSARERRRLQSVLAKRVACESLSAVVHEVSTRPNVSPALIGALVDWVSTAADPWTREVGHLWRAACIGDTALAESALVSLGIHAASQSGMGRWDFSISTPAYVRVDQWVMRGVGSGSVFSDGRHLSATFGFSGGRLSVSREPERSRPWSASGDLSNIASAPEVPGTAGSMTVVPDVVLSSTFLPDHARSRFAHELVCAKTARSVARALALIERADPGVSDWVQSVVREVSPLMSIPGSVGSTSSIWDFGSVGVTFGDGIRDFLVAEMLVHEASHQQFFLAKTWGPLVNEQDKGGYYSPMVDSDRPIEKILLAYHVLVNLLAFYAALERHLSAADLPAASRRREALRLKLKNVNATIFRSAGLSSFGSALAAKLRIREVALPDFWPVLQ